MDDPDDEARKARNAAAVKRYRQKRPLEGYDFYRKSGSGTAPVEKFWHALKSKRERDEFQTEMDMLGSLGPDAGARNSKYVRDKISEWRWDTNSCTYRLLYAVDEELRRAILLHVIVKDTYRLRQKDIEIAEKRWADYLQQKQSQKQKSHLSH